MPVHFFASAVSSTVPTEYWATIAASLVAISLLKTWSKGAKLLDDQRTRACAEAPRADKRFVDLHGRIILVATGAFTPLGVVTLASLAHRGAQIIALTASISSPAVIQMIELIRDSTQSELIYAEQCDVGSLESISAFAALWNSGDKKQQEGVRRLDGLLFLPPGREELQNVQVQTASTGTSTSRKDRIYQLHVLARLHLVNSLLSSLLVQPPEREVRIVSVMSPFYAAGVAHFDVLSSATSTSEPKNAESEAETRGPTPLQTRSESSYSALIGAASLRWYVLTVELQRRLDLLAEADPRPRTKLGGVEMQARADAMFAPRAPPSGSRSTSVEAQVALRMKRHSNISIINVCAGFERSSDIIDTFFPPASLVYNDAFHKFIFIVRTSVRLIVLLIVWPVLWLLAKSPATAADSVVWATTRTLESLSERHARITTSLTQPARSLQPNIQVTRRNDNLIPAELYREGNIIRPPLPQRFHVAPPDHTDTDDAWSQLWMQDEQEVERRITALGGHIQRPKV